MQQTYFPNLTTSLLFMNQKELANEYEANTQMNVSRHTVSISAKEEGGTNGQSITVYHSNEKESVSDKTYIKKNKRSFSDIHLELMKLEEEVSAKKDGGQQTTIFGYQLSLLSGVMICGTKKASFYS